MSGKTLKVFIRFTQPTGKMTVEFQPGEVHPNIGHSQLKELALAKADPSGTRKVVECRVV